MNKDKIKNLILVMIVAVISGSLSSILTTNNLSGNKILGSVSYSDYLDSSNVTYSNSNVQDSIDSLYTQANDYSSINTRVNALENHFQNNSTGYFDGPNLYMNGNGPTGNNGVYFLLDNISRGEIAVTNNGKLVIKANDESGNIGKGTLDLQGESISINGKDITGIGKQYYYGPTTSIGVNSGTTHGLFGSYTLPSAGVWLTFISVEFSSNSSGIRTFEVFEDSSLTSSLGMISRDTKNAVSGLGTNLRSVFYVNTTSSKTYYIGGFQNSGTRISENFRVYAIRIN